MQIGAVIAEYNPFHKGHQWQLEQIKKQGISHVAVIMSPDFTQRGTPAVFPKRVRAQAALQNGADLILELPDLVTPVQGHRALHLVQYSWSRRWGVSTF